MITKSTRQPTDTHRLAAWRGRQRRLQQSLLADMEPRSESPWPDILTALLFIGLITWAVFIWWAIETQTGEPETREFRNHITGETYTRTQRDWGER